MKQRRARNGSPFDYPLSSRFDENDAIFVMDNVFVPWEDVFIYRDPARVMSFFPGSGFVHGSMFQGCTRYAVKLDFISGLLAKALRCTGGDEARNNQVLLGEVIAWRHLFWALSDAMANNPRAVERRRGAAGIAGRPCLSRVRSRLLAAHQGHRAEDRDLGADLSAVLGEGFRQSGNRSVSAPICPRLA